MDVGAALVAVAVPRSSAVVRAVADVQRVDTIGKTPRRFISAVDAPIAAARSRETTPIERSIGPIAALRLASRRLSPNI